MMVLFIRGKDWKWIELEGVTRFPFIISLGII
jgi:hypothetical protein